MDDVVAQLVVDPTNPARCRLDVVGVPQSFVDLDDPTDLVFGYVQAMGAVLDAVPGVHVVHVGGGAMTLVRFLNARRPATTHLVLEPDADLTARVLAALPFAPRATVEIRPVDGATGIAELAPDSVDVVVIDAAVGDVVPQELVRAAFLRSVRDCLAPAGVVLGNVPGRPGRPARLPPAVAEVFACHATVAPPAVHRNGAGNLVYVASQSALPVTRIGDAAAALDPPQQVV